MAPSQAPGFPRPSPEVPYGYSLRLAPPGEGGVPESAVHGALIRDRPFPTLHQAANLHSPFVLRSKSRVGTEPQLLQALLTGLSIRREEGLPREEGLREGQR